MQGTAILHSLNLALEDAEIEGLRAKIKKLRSLGTTVFGHDTYLHREVG